jgi:hypothetical protein
MRYRSHANKNLNPTNLRAKEYWTSVIPDAAAFSGLCDTMIKVSGRITELFGDLIGLIVMTSIGEDVETSIMPGPVTRGGPRSTPEPAHPRRLYPPSLLLFGCDRFDALHALRRRRLLRQASTPTLTIAADDTVGLPPCAGKAVSRAGAYGRVPAT